MEIDGGASPRAPGMLQRGERDKNIKQRNVLRFTALADEQLGQDWNERTSQQWSVQTLRNKFRRKMDGWGGEGGSCEL